MRSFHKPIFAFPIILIESRNFMNVLKNINIRDLKRSNPSYTQLLKDHGPQIRILFTSRAELIFNCKSFYFNKAKFYIIHDMSDFVNLVNLEFSKMFPLFCSFFWLLCHQAGSVFLVRVIPEVIIRMKAETPIYQ